MRVVVALHELHNQPRVDSVLEHGLQWAGVEFHHSKLIFSHRVVVLHWRLYHVSRKCILLYDTSVTMVQPLGRIS